MRRHFVFRSNMEYYRCICVSFILLGFSISILPGSCSEWKWKDKVAVVTGASSGIGAAIAIELANKGMIVVGMARRDYKIKELSSKTNGTLHAVKCDLTVEEEVIKAFEWVKKTLGGVDVLVNDAGVFHPGGLVGGSLEEWKNSVNVNVLGMALATREALITMRQRGDNGTIININSLSAYSISELYLVSMYTTSKFGVIGLTKSLRVELMQLKSGIRVTSINPGYVKTTGSTESDVPHLVPADVVEGVIFALGVGTKTEVADLTIQPLGHSVCNG